MIELGRTKGPSKVKMKGIDPQKNFSSANIKEVPRAYESLNPALLKTLSLTPISQ